MKKIRRSLSKIPFLQSLKSKLRFFLMLGMVLPTHALAQTSEPTVNDQAAVIEIIRLQHRDASSIRQAITPHIDSRGTINQMDNNLIVATSRGNLRDLRALVAQLDTPLRSLRVSLDFDYRTPSADNVLSTDASDRGNAVRTVQMQEGEAAVVTEQINSEDIIGLGSGTAAVLLGENTRSESSFRVRAEIRGQQILLQLHALTQDSVDGASNDSQSVGTTLTLTPGQWFIINPTEVLFSDSGSNSSEILSTSPESEAGLRQLAVLAEILP